MNKIATTVLLILLNSVCLNLTSQIKPDKSKSIFQTEWNTVLTRQDSILALSIPELIVPDTYKYRNGRDLPYILNNAILPYFRPIFSQESFANCGQSAGIGYNFTYELNRARGLPANDESNQYTPQFTWNFMNGGEGWYGVSYFHSFEILKSIGNPSVQDYGGMYAGGDQRWMSGYDSYFHSIHNRINEVYYIDISSAEGLNTLKYWLYDHLEGSETGGVACFYAASPWNYTTLPNDTPEAGKFVIREWEYPATHAMTIVGYNDSIRYDYNNDGKYTNDVDLNGDGRIDMKDWEIGGLLFANSYGTGWADSGFCYLMYNSLAHKYGEGGVWNQTVNVIDVNPEYTPSAGVRLKIKHNSRNKLKILVGVSTDTVLNYPTKIMDLPIINFQGGDNIMQGIDTIDKGDELELEFDITRLLGELNNDNLARFFIEIIEKDPENVSHGEIMHFSVVDYSDHQETVCLDTPKTIHNNGSTVLSIVKEIHFDKMEIVTEELPAFQPGIPFNFQIEAAGGQQPYKWSFLKAYKIKPLESEFPINDGEVIEFTNDDNDFISVPLPFPFPYYGDTLDHMNIHIDGFVSFEDGNLPYPYFIGESTMLTDNKIIAPCMSDLKINASTGESVAIDSTNDFLTIYWNVSSGFLFESSSLLFALKLFPTGEIITYYMDVNIPDGMIWTTGISNGDLENYAINHVTSYKSSIFDKGFLYFPLSDMVSDMELHPNGELEGLIQSDHHIKQINVQVKDKRNVTQTKKFQLSTGLLLSYSINSGNDRRLDFGETASLNAIIKNISLETIENISLNYSLEDEFITILNEKVHVGHILPGETVVLDNALVFEIASHINDQHILELNNSLISNGKNWELSFYFEVNAPVLSIHDIASNGHQWIEPGLTNQVTVQVDNSGHSLLKMTEARFVSESDDIEIIGNELVTIDNLSPNERVDINYRIKANPLVSSGINVACTIEYYNGGNFISENNFDLQIGKNSVLLVDMDPDHTSISQLKNDLEELNVSYVVSSAIPTNLNDHKSVFVLLGALFSNHELNYAEGLKLDGYLNSEGKLYMEGRASWMQQQTPVHDMFNVEIASNGSYFPIDTVYLNPNETALKFNHEYPYSNHYFITKGGSYPILNFRKTDSACVVVNKTDVYSTIASIVEYGSLATIDTSFTRIDYLYQLTDFFELYKTTIGINEYEKTENNNVIVNVYPNPFLDYVNIQFVVSAPTEVKIFNSKGQLVFSNHYEGDVTNTCIKNITWHGQDLNQRKVMKGVYYLHVQSGNAHSMAKIIHF